MKKIIIFLCLSFSISIYSQEKLYKSPDKNFHTAVAEFEKSYEEFRLNKDVKLELEKASKTFSSIYCIQSFAEKVDPMLIRKSLMVMEGNNELEERISKLKDNKDFIKIISKITFKAMNNPISLCSFEIDENTEEMKSIKKEKEAYAKKYNEILNLKKTIHPVFRKMIQDLEQKKIHLSSPSSGPIDLTTNIFEKNFDLVYEYQTKYIESKSLAILSKMHTKCIENIMKNYQTICSGKPKYNPIKGRITKFLLCADDNFNKIDKGCNYEIVFTATSS